MSIVPVLSSPVSRSLMTTSGFNLVASSVFRDIGRVLIGSVELVSWVVELLTPVLLLVILVKPPVLSPMALSDPPALVMTLATLLDCPPPVLSFVILVKPPPSPFVEPPVPPTPAPLVTTLLLGVVFATFPPSRVTRPFSLRRFSFAAFSASRGSADIFLRSLRRTACVWSYDDRWLSYSFCLA